MFGRSDSAAAKRSSGSELHFTSDRVIKCQAPEQSRRERIRTEFGAGVAGDLGLFQVPEVIEYDDEEGWISFQYIPGTVTLRDHLVERPDPELLERTGRALAAIHSAHNADSSHDVPWHGDFGLGNILYREASDKLVIVDWANALWSDEQSERSRGSPGLDLGIMLISVFHHRLIGPKYIRDPETLGAAFLETYIRGRAPVEMESVHEYINGLLHRFGRYLLRQRGAAGALAHYPSLVRFRLFLSKVR